MQGPGGRSISGASLQAMQLGTADLVELADVDALTDKVDALCFDGAWSAVVDLRDRCRAALERGKQLWPAAAYAEYRLALDAPGPVAASVADSAAERFTLGPFSEVMASTHTFADLAHHLVPTPAASITAHERVVRGEDLRADDIAMTLPDVLGLPLRLEPWEPVYPVAKYEPGKATFPTPDAHGLRLLAGPHPPSADVVRDPEVVEALVDLAQAWVRGSNGRAQAVAVEGTAAQAIAALGPQHVRMAPITGADAMAWMAWTAASGGANGRRRGMAAGRHAAWWALAALAGLADSDDEPATPDELGRALDELRWYLWDDGSPATGWVLRLAVEEPTENLAWAVSASDAALG